MTHLVDCPDKAGRFGEHTTCPCPHCFDTGYLNADPEEIECDCAADFQPESDKLAECDRISALGGWTRATIQETRLREAQS
jgi:hypothetical protein